jgi:multidrug efflux pump subunit AcrB
MPQSWTPSAAFPGVTFSFLPADIISQILNFGAPSPIDIQVRTSDLAAGFEHANKLLARVRTISGIVDARIQQSRQAPVFAVDIDRTRAQFVGLTTRDVTNSLVVNLAGSGQVAPTYWLNPVNNITYNIVMQTPQYRLDSLASLSNLPIMAPAATSRRMSAKPPSTCNEVAAGAMIGRFDSAVSESSRYCGVCITML